MRVVKKVDPPATPIYLELDEEEALEILEFLTNTRDHHIQIENYNHVLSLEEELTDELCDRGII